MSSGHPKSQATFAQGPGDAAEWCADALDGRLGHLSSYLCSSRASGNRITDIDGNTYIDFCLGDTGAMFGHSPEATAEAVCRQVRRGITTMLPTEDALWIGRELARRFGLPFWQVAMTATEANRYVIRICRTLTGRPKTLVMNECYHGSVDETLPHIGPDGRLGTAFDLRYQSRSAQRRPDPGGRVQ